MKITLVNFNKVSSQLINKINWVRAAGRYVILDPNNNGVLLYLEEKQYIKLLDVSLSNDVHLTVLSTPDDSEELVRARLSDPTGAPKGTPNLDDWISRRSQVFSMIDGWDIKDSMIEFKRNFEKFFPIYYRDILTWLGLPYRSLGYKEMNRFSLFMSKIRTTRGINQVISILKIQSIVVLQYLAGTPLQSTQELGQRIRLVNGLPKHLPPYFRVLIRNRDKVWVTLILTLLHSYKGLKGIHKAPDMSSITAPRFVRPLKYEGFDPEQIKYSSPSIEKIFSQDWDEVDNCLGQFWKDFNPTKVEPDLIGYMKDAPFPLTSGPNSSVSFLSSVWDSLAIVYGKKADLLSYHKAIVSFAKSRKESVQENAMIVPFMESIAHSFKQEIEKGKLTGKQFLGMSRLLQLYCNDTQDVRSPGYPPGISLKNSKEENYSVVINWDFISSILPLMRVGKLAIKKEAAGKVRVFAISDYFTQWLMKPLHKSLFNVLRVHPSDATFDQLGKVKEFQDRNYSFIASYDLKSATDLIPIQLYEKVLAQWTSKEVAEAWSSCLTGRDYGYHVKSSLEDTVVNYKYSRGQPMGTLSSWASLAMVHHFLVFLAARRLSLVNFRDYLVLGDDIVIGHKAVAESYCQICNEYGITIGFAKSFVSTIGMFQFASQDIIKGDNISPVSLKETLTVANLSRYFGPHYNMAKTVEFITRSVRRGFIGSKPLDMIRASSNYLQWSRYSKLLTRGIFPPEVGKMLVGLLSRDYSLLENSSSLDQLIASLRGDIRLFTGNLTYSSSERIRFQRLVEKLLLDQISLTLNRLSRREIDTKPDFGLETLYRLFHMGTFAIKYDRADSLITFNRVVNKFKFVITQEHKLTPMEYMLKYDSDATKASRDFQRILQLLKIKGELDALMIKVDLVKATVNQLDGRAPYLVRFHLSLLSELDRLSGKNQTWM